MSKDTISDLITSIRNADMAKKETVRIASTNITENIVKILLRKGFIENVRKRKQKKWICVSSKKEVHHGHFILCVLTPTQTQTLAISMESCLLRKRGIFKINATYPELTRRVRDFCTDGPPL